MKVARPPHPPHPLPPPPQTLINAVVFQLKNFHSKTDLSERRISSIQLLSVVVFLYCVVYFCVQNSDIELWLVMRVSV